MALHVSLTGLQGLTYPIPALGSDRDVAAVTYADWMQFVLEPGAGPEPLFEPEGASPLDAVLASAANPGGFAPRLLDRSGDAAGYRDRGITNFPSHGRLWYGDGGLVQAEPLGRVVRAGRAEERNASGPTDSGVEIRRVNLVVDPRSEGPSGSGRWSDPDAVPGWEEGLSRALAILPAQVLYDDLRRIEKRNTRLEWADALVEALAPSLDASDAERLAGVLERIAEDRRRTGGSRTDEGAGSPEESDPRRALRRAVEEVAGLVGKERVEVDVISPRILAEETGEDVPALLAGEFLGDFGGFLRQPLRESDFRLGYECTRVWLPGALEAAGFDAAAVRRVADRVEAESPGDWREANRGEAGVRSLPWRARLRMARFVAHVGRVVAAAILKR